MTRTTPGSIAPARPAAQVDDGTLDTQPRATVIRIRNATLGLGIAVLVALEAIDAVRVVRRRAAHLAADWWAGVERQERRDERRAGFVGLAVPIVRAMADPAPGSGRHPARGSRPRS